MSGNALDARAKLHHITDTRETVDPVHECVLVMLPKSILCQSPVIQASHALAAARN